MEARIGGESQLFYANGASSLNAFGKKSFEWDLNNWNWDGDLFIASPLNAGPPDCRNKQLFPAAANGGPSNSSSSCSEEADFGIAQRGKGEAEKRRRIVVVEDGRPYDGAGSLALKLGGHAYPVVEAELADGKKSKFQGGNANGPMCQVEACGADLSNSKDYHRRHKVCEMHAKATTALVNNVMQRFCQQCSRFHLLQEFDEGKRSCRRRLAGHNRRRRKTHPDVTVGGASSVDERASSYLLITLLRILSNLQSESSEQSNNQDLLSHLLRSLANLAGSLDVRHLSDLLQASQDPERLGNTAGPSSEVANASASNCATLQELVRPLCSASKMAGVTVSQGPSKPTNNTASDAVPKVDLPSKRNAMVASPESAVERARLKDFDLNSTYSDVQGCGEGHDNSATPVSMGTGSPNGPSWLHQEYHHSSPPQTSGHSDSTSAQSLSSSNGEAQSRTDRIVFKLFGKDPNDFPLVLRAQILEWLSQSPTDMESYIRPGCVVLTVYLRLRKSLWEELCRGLRSYLNRLVQNSGNDFWRTGWVYARVQHHVAFIHNGHVLLDTPLLHGCPDHCRIVCVTPIAVSHSTKVNFKVKGFNVARSSARLLCSFEGKYLVPEYVQALVESTGVDGEHGELHCLSFSCSLPSATGRGFIEVEDHGLSNDFFPFIVAEEKVCSEICTLENVIDVASHCDQERSDAKDARTQALEFLNELGWLLRRNQLRSRSQQMKSCPNVFPLSRFRWLMTFAMDREWCAVVKKLLDILFEGTVDVGGYSPIEFALSEDLLHSAVRRKCKPMVEILLRYAPDRTSKESGLDRFLFRPDRLGPSNLTPVHIAATIGDAESILDALTDDPGQLGIEAWKNARDSTGFSPEDYARARGYDSYIQLVQKKIDKQLNKGHVALDIPSSLIAPGASNKFSDGSGVAKLAGFGIDKSRATSIKHCNLCSQQLAHKNSGAMSFLYRPAMLSMVGIAAICVCVGIYFQGPPKVFNDFRQFTWKSLKYGSI